MPSNNSIYRTLLSSGAANTFLVVILGALASHALKPQMSATQIELWQTGIFYHTLHAMSFFILAFLNSKHPGLGKKWLFLASLAWIGILCFSGGLYLLALNFTTLHFLIPIGGLLWLILWGRLFWLSLKLK